MCDEYELFEYLEDDLEEEIENKNASAIQRTSVRQQNDPFLMDDVQFVKRYRLTKELVSMLCDELQSFVTPPPKSRDLSIKTKVLIALSFYATGSYQRVIGDMAGHSVAQETVSLVLGQVTQLLNLPYFRNKYIKFPRDVEQHRANMIRFNNKFGMPGVIGCIDCTHVAIVRPAQHEERYYCRKQYHSLNVQLICNSEMDFTSVDASYGGATHDSFIWSYHPIKMHLEQLNDAVWLLGDSGYPLRKTMMTPVLDARPGSPEAHYTQLHVLARNTIERAIGLLKARFRCLLVHRVLHYEPLMAASIVNACVILHNICNRANAPVHELTSDEVLQEAQLQPLATHLTSIAVESSRTQSSELSDGMTARQHLIAQLWSRRRTS